MPRFAWHAVAAVAIGSLLAACGGGGGSSAPPGALPAVGATSAAGAASPGSTPAAGGPGATAAPGAGGSASTTFLGFLNPSSWPGSFRPFAATSVFNSLVPANPKIASYSSAVVANQFPGGAGGPVRVTEAGQYDYSHPVFYATAADPLVSLNCQNPAGSIDCGAAGSAFPLQIHIPAKARPAGGTDHQFTIVAPDGSMVDFWSVIGTPGFTTGSGNSCTAASPYPPRQQTRDWQNGDCLVANNITNAGNISTGSGIVTPPGANVAGTALIGGLITATELISGTISHALYISGQCGIGHQFPGQGNTQACTSGIGPPIGGLEWYDIPCATTRANTALQPWEQGILCALNQYGGYFLDNGSGGAFFTGGTFGFTQSEESTYDYAGAPYTSPYAALASQGWNIISIANPYLSASGVSLGPAGNRWAYNSDNNWQPNGVDFPDHIHWLDPCVAQKTC
jgi:hypothetical protein